MAKSSNDAAHWLPAARAGSPEALGRALEACRRYLLEIANRELDRALQAKGGASDIVQQTFMEAQRDFPRFGGDSEEELRAWLRQMLLHNLGKFARQYRGTQKRRVGREVALNVGGTSADNNAQLAASTPSPSGQAMEQEQARALEAAMLRLPDDYRQVIRLRYQDELSFEEIGRQLNRSAGAARKLWVRAVERLQQEMGPPP
jgi:RNA polymerase sigma-70 factor (ECF subfamily)